jgi:hypothetical protein
LSKKKKPRRLWLNIRASNVNVSREKFVQVLMDSIENGSYKLPKKWKVILEWRNKESAPMRVGTWTEEMQKSASSSPGFDYAVSSWLGRKL